MAWVNVTAAGPHTREAAPRSMRAASADSCSDRVRRASAFFVVVIAWATVAAVSATSRESMGAVNTDSRSDRDHKADILLGRVMACASKAAGRAARLRSRTPR